MSSIVNDIRKFYSDIVGDNGRFLSLEEYISKMRRAYPKFEIKERQYDLLVNITYLAVNTKITGRNTKNYIRSNEGSVRKFVESYNLTVDESEKLKPASVSQNVNYDRKKLLEFFPDNIMTKARSFSWEERIKDYEKRLNKANAKYSGNKELLDNIALKIPNSAAVDVLSDESFMELISLIGPYTRSHMKYVSENLPADQIGYLNYLVSASRLDGENLDRFNILESVLLGEYRTEIETATKIEIDEQEIEIEANIESEKQEIEIMEQEIRVEEQEIEVEADIEIEEPEIELEAEIAKPEIEAKVEIEIEEPDIEIDFGDLDHIELDETELAEINKMYESESDKKIEKQRILDEQDIKNGVEIKNGDITIRKGGLKTTRVQF